MGLSEPVQAALPHAVRAVEDILREHRTQGKGEKDDGKLIKAAVLAALIAVVIDSMPDIKRYLEIREM